MGVLLRAFHERIDRIVAATASRLLRFSGKARGQLGLFLYRRYTLFDPEEYFESLEKAISDSNCRSWAQTTGPGPDYPQIELDRFKQWALIVWRFEVIFPEHGILKAIEIHSRSE